MCQVPKIVQEAVPQPRSGGFDCVYVYWSHGPLKLSTPDDFHRSSDPRSMIFERLRTLPHLPCCPGDEACKEGDADPGGGT